MATKIPAMKIGYGRKRLAWYAGLGLLTGAVLLLLHNALEATILDYHNWILFALIPASLALAMILLARTENRLFRRTERLEAARARVTELMLGAVAQKRSSATAFIDPSLETCWQRLGCDKEDCPAYGIEHARCWLIAGTFCRGQVQGQFAKKLEDCRLCEVYQNATKDPVDEITENFYAMNYLLSEREEQLEKAYKDAQARSEKLTGLVSMSEAALSSMHLTDLLQNLLESSASLVGADLGYISLADTSGDFLLPRVSFGAMPGMAADLADKVGEGIVGRAYAGGYIAISEELDKDSRQTNMGLKALGAQTLISMPLLASEERVGMLTLATLTPHRYSEEEKDALSVAAGRIAAAVENARLAGEVGRDREQAELMAAVTAEISTGDGMSAFYESFIQHASRIIDFDQSSMFIWHPETSQVEIVASRTKAARTWLTRGLMLPLEASAADKVIETGNLLIREEIAGEEYPVDKLLSEEGIRSAVMFPLLSKGDVLGVIQLGSFDANAFSREDVELIEPVTRQLGLVLDNIRVVQEAERSSLVDSLTQLYSHRFFYEVLKREISMGERYKRPVSLIMMRLNGFKEFNEGYGHHEADEVLKAIADILRNSVREIDTVARYGGREFAVLLPEANAVAGDPHEMDAWGVAERIRDNILSLVFVRKAWAGSPLSLSMGIAEFPVHAADADSLLERADWALREARDHGANEVIVAKA